MKTILRATFLFCLTAKTTGATAGPYTFSDVLVGDRAMGMGGAFAGVADDSSALFYNPAGLAYASSASLTAAVNAAQFTHREYQNLFAGKDSFYEKSQDLIPSFTGGVINLKKLADGLHGAFALQNLSQLSSNQNDFIRRPDVGLDYLHRAEKSQTSELTFSMGAGKKVAANLAWGISLGGRQLSFDRQQFQDSTIKANLSQVKLSDAITGAGKTLYLARALNLRESAVATSLELGSGIMWSPAPWLSLGLSGHVDYILNQTVNKEGDELGAFHYNDLSLPSAADFEALPNSNAELARKEIETLSNKVIQRTTSNNGTTAISQKNARANFSNEESGSFGRSRFRLGIAAFPSQNLLLTFDVVGHHSRTEWILMQPLLTNYVLNAHQGLEYFFTPQFFIRQGLFTNFDSRPKELQQPLNVERIDFAGVSVFAGTQTNESQFSLGCIYQYGWGEALKASGQSIPSPVRESRILLAFTATHGL